MNALPEVPGYIACGYVANGLPDVPEFVAGRYAANGLHDVPGFMAGGHAANGLPEVPDGTSGRHAANALPEVPEGTSGPLVASDPPHVRGDSAGLSGVSDSPALPRYTACPSDCGESQGPPDSGRNLLHAGWNGGSINPDPVTVCIKSLPHAATESPGCPAGSGEVPASLHESAGTGSARSGDAVPPEALCIAFGNQVQRGPEIAVRAASGHVETGAIIARMAGLGTGTPGTRVQWGTEIHAADRLAPLPMWGTEAPGGDQGRVLLPNRGDAVLPETDPTSPSLPPGGENAVQSRIGDLLTGGAFGFQAGMEQSLQGGAKRAQTPAADGGKVPGQPVPADGTAGAATAIGGRHTSPPGETECISLNAARGGDSEIQMMNKAITPRVEPAVTREDAEGAFALSAPQGTVFSDGEKASPDGAVARAVVYRVCDEALEARASGRTSARFDLATETGEIVRVRIAIRSNAVSARIGVMDPQTKEVLALHIPELNQRLATENLVPERFDIYLMNGHGDGSGRGGRRKPGSPTRETGHETTEDEFIYVSTEPRAFEKWA